MTAHRVNAFFKRKLKTRGRFGNALMPDRCLAGSFAGNGFAATGNRALHVVSRDAFDHELHQTIVQKNPVAGLHHARQLLEGRRGALRIPNDVLTR
jgi:hypothetical protein